MTMPNFLIIGAPRTSTTTLYEMLIQHPEIYMPSLKEPWFFAFEGREGPFQGPVHYQGVRDLETYQSLFKDVKTKPQLVKRLHCIFTVRKLLIALGIIFQT